MATMKKIRNDPNAFAEAMLRRNMSYDVINDIIDRLGEIAYERREYNAAIEEAAAHVKTVETSIRNWPEQKDPEFSIEDLRGLAITYRATIATNQHKISELRERENSIVLALPNYPAPSTPDGTSEADNVVVSTPIPVVPPTLRKLDHVSLAQELGMWAGGIAAEMAGSRMSMLVGDLARLERALGQFMLDQAADAGYVEVSPPLLVKGSALVHTGQLPKFKDDLYAFTNEHRETKYLIPTAEVPLTNMLATTMRDAPHTFRWCALTPCFRLEAGSAGRDTHGMFRQHQFYKTELVTACPSEEVDAEFDKMVDHVSKNVLAPLGLPHRIVSLCCGDLGFSARRTYDVEVWIPSHSRYREISSISDCGDFQTSRMDDYGRFTRKGSKQLELYHTLNGSGVAVGRALIAVMENYQTDDGDIIIPDVLVPYMRGQKKICRDTNRRLIP